MKLVITIFLLSILSLNAQDEAILKLFPGKWKMESDKLEYYEEWKIVNDTELLGNGYDIENSNKKESETIYLKKFGTEWAYVAIPINQTITLFALTSFSGNKFIFENGEHDFPQRVIYEFVSDTQLNARVEGMIEGELMSRDFTFIRTEK